MAKEVMVLRVAETDVDHATRAKGKQTLWLLFAAALAAGFFHLAFEIPALNCAVLLYAFLLIELSKAARASVAFRLGFLAGLLVHAPQLTWFWTIFGPAAICLWAILSFYTGLFVLLVHGWRQRFGTKLLWLVAPGLWMTLEYFRSEGYFLKFSWLSVGYVFSGKSGILPIGELGVYGCGFLIFLLAAIGAQFEQKRRWLVVALSIAALAIAVSIPRKQMTMRGTPLRVAGMQLEFPPELKVPEYLDRLITAYPDAELLVLSEYTFDGPIPKRVRDWCRKHRKYLIVGGKADAPGAGQFYNTAFVVGPTGEIVFDQVKSVPIQFFKDGLPALSQKLWESPWGKIAICVCYDMSYRSVMDRFMRQGAQALIVPFMDIADWGAQQHRQHANVGPIRALEYRVPIFRVGSSGISQLIDVNGHAVSSLSFPGQGEMIGGTLLLGAKASLPLDSFR
jgi:apolipoprotein N-acyltransferase